MLYQDEHSGESWAQQNVRIIERHDKEIRDLQGDVKLIKSIALIMVGVVSLVATITGVVEALRAIGG